MFPFAPMLPAPATPTQKFPSLEELPLSNETRQRILRLTRDRPIVDPKQRVSKSIATPPKRAVFLLIAVTFRMVGTSLQDMATEHNIDIRTIRRFMDRTKREGDYFFLSLPGEKVLPKRRKRKLGGGTTPPKKKSVSPHSVTPSGFPHAFVPLGFPHSVTPSGFPHAFVPLGFPLGFPPAFAPPGFPPAVAPPGFPSDVRTAAEGLLGLGSAE